MLFNSVDFWQPLVFLAYGRFNLTRTAAGLMPKCLPSGGELRLYGWWDWRFRRSSRLAPVWIGVGKAHPRFL